MIAAQQTKLLLPVLLQYQHTSLITEKELEGFKEETKKARERAIER